MVSVDLDGFSFFKTLSLCKHWLIAWVVLVKGERPWILSELKAKLSKLWNLSSWKLISLVEDIYRFCCIWKHIKAEIGHWVWFT